MLSRVMICQPLSCTKLYWNSGNTLDIKLTILQKLKHRFITKEWSLNKIFYVLNILALDLYVAFRFALSIWLL